MGLEENDYRIPVHPLSIATGRHPLTRTLDPTKTNQPTRDLIGRYGPPLTY